MRCYACHQPVGANARFCSTCGATLAFAAPTQPHQPFAAPAQSRVQPQQLFATPLQPQQPFAADPANGPFSLLPQLPHEQQQVAPRMGPLPFAPAPVDGVYAPFDDAAPAAIPLNYAYAPAGVAAPYGYMPAVAPPPVSAPAQAPSMVNNVMVTQLTPPAPAPAIVVDASGGGAGVALRALFFLLTGIALGAFWVGAVLSGGSTAAWALLVAAAATVAVLLLDIAILNRYPHR